jgi:hypothetical protein
LLSLDNGETWQLYAINDDPAESHDISANHPEKVAQMKRDLMAWQQSCSRSAAGDAYRSG